VDPAELSFPYDDPTLFLSMEDERRLEVNPREIKESYLEEFNRFLEANAEELSQKACVTDEMTPISPAPSL